MSGFRQRFVRGRQTGGRTQVDHTSPSMSAQTVHFHAPKPCRSTRGIHGLISRVPRAVSSGRNFQLGTRSSGRQRALPSWSTAASSAHRCVVRNRQVRIPLHPAPRHCDQRDGARSAALAALRSEAGARSRRSGALRCATPPRRTTTTERSRATCRAARGRCAATATRRRGTEAARCRRGGEGGTRAASHVRRGRGEVADGEKEICDVGPD